jgi:hypothetical protein
MEQSRGEEGANDEPAHRWIEQVIGARVVGAPEVVQSLWSGYGRIERLAVREPTDGLASVILKAVEPPKGTVDHPRGFGTDLSHQRKLKSYRVEQVFYRDFSVRLQQDEARVPRLLGQSEQARDSWLLLEDLDAEGFDGRRTEVTPEERTRCLRWLANFHARFMDAAPVGLWDRGTYWHLATRPDELAAMQDDSLRDAAGALDDQLESAVHRTVLHGDAKLANFCFGADGVAAVDFQYAGGGVGVQDVAYFLGSCLADGELERHAEADLDLYFDELRLALSRFHPACDGGAIENEWRTLWATSWADFHRFLVGWAPGHWKLSNYSASMLEEALRRLR